MTESSERAVEPDAGAATPGRTAAVPPPDPRPTRRHRFDRAALRADLRAAVPDATAALVVTALIYAWLYARVQSGTSATLAVMPFLADADTYWMYWLCQAFGWSALLWSWITLVLGLVRSSARPAPLRVPAARVERWHRTTSLTTMGLMFAHAFLFFAELVRDNGDELAWPGRLTSAFTDTFVPGGYTSGTGRLAILIGLLAFYLAVPLGLAYYLRRSTGGRTWRALHRFIVVVYVLSVWHTLLYGTNVWYDGTFRTLVWLLQLPVAALFLARLLAPARRGDRLGPPPRRTAPRHPFPYALPYALRLAARLAAAATLVVLLAVPATGRDGGRTPDGEATAPGVEPGTVWAGLAVLCVTVAITAYRTRPRAAVGTGTTSRTGEASRMGEAPGPS
ncbi:ferric reductase-like transmembrane domain-containing protein [Streptomyces phytohabitans]|uniref:ferric reductase-like transmembrane domain-containing protein n=1 Tax=Streptomyces phytohabitans TaxID=1150371 RepID=UPI00345BB6DD